ncbi:MAG: YpdA family putative bacillithiol disulfide reductase [Acidobacteriia bacterium]|nr:YpdA family putative bacillithiol disulfide reductase [Terriglobia bacterium]
MPELLDVVVVGGGPTGLACAIEAVKANLSTLVIEKGCLVNSIFHYPTEMIFFTSRDLLEIGEVPMPSINVKPTRAEALEYYRRVAEFFRLPIRLYERVTTVTGSDGHFQVLTQRDGGQRCGYETRKIILATGYYDLPNMLGIEGESLPKVSHYYTSAHPFYRQKVAVIGGANSAADAALDLYRHGAEVTLIHREHELGRNIKYWVRPDVENRIKEGSIRGLFDSVVTEIAESWIRVESKAGEVLQLENDFVFVLTGYHPDFDFIKSTGVELDPETCRPVCNAQTLESNVPGIYLAGVIIAGYETNEIFIENGRFHGKQIIGDIRKKV